MIALLGVNYHIPMTGILSPVTHLSSSRWIRMRMSQQPDKRETDVSLKPFVGHFSTLMAGDSSLFSVFKNASVLLSKAQIPLFALDSTN